MNADEYKAALKRLGFNQITIAPVLGINPRTSQRYAAHGAPGPVGRLLAYIEKHGPAIANEMKRAA